MTEPATTGYKCTMRRACGHEETVTLYGNQTRRNEQRRRARAEVCAECKPADPAVTRTRRGNDKHQRLPDEMPLRAHHEQGVCRSPRRPVQAVRD